METDGFDPRPTPQQARAALDMAAAEESATVNRPVPAWYFPVLAMLVLALFLLNAAAHDNESLRVIAGLAVVLVAVVIAILVGRVSIRQPGYHGVRVQWRATLPMVGAAVVLAIAPVLLVDLLGAWIWVVCGVLLAALIAVTGVLYWQRYGRV